MGVTGSFLFMNLAMAISGDSAFENAAGVAKHKCPDRTFTEPCANACPRLRQAPRMMQAVLEREYQCQCRGSWRGLFPNAAVLALRHAPADSDNRTAFDEPNQAAAGTVVRHSEQIICLPAEPDKLVSEIAKQERCVIDCRFPNERRHAWRALRKQGLPRSLETLWDVVRAKRRFAPDGRVRFRPP